MKVTVGFPCIPWISPTISYSFFYRKYFKVTEHALKHLTWKNARLDGFKMQLTLWFHHLYLIKLNKVEKALNIAIVPAVVK